MVESTDQEPAQEPFPVTQRCDWLWWILIVLIVVGPRAFDLDLFYARDELTIWDWSDQFAMAVWRGDPGATFTGSDYPGIPMFWGQTLFLTVKYSFPNLFSSPLVPPDKLTEIQTLELLAERRLVSGLLVSLQIIAAVWMVRRLFGWPVALVAAIFMGLDPFSLTEARLFRLEMISAYFVCLSVLAYFVYLRGQGRQWLAVSGIMAGLGVSSKTSAGLVVPFIWLLLLLELLLAGRLFEAVARPTWFQQFRRVVANGLIWAVGAIGAFWVIWPAMWVKPLAVIRYVFLAGLGQAASRSVWGDEVFFWGQIIDGGDPGPFFYPVVLAFRTTPLTWIGVAGALFFLGLALYQGVKSRAGFKLPWTAAGILLLLIYVGLVMAGLTFVISKVDRFLLIVFPELSILSALGLVILLNWLARWSGRRSAGAYVWLPRAGVVLILILQLLITLPVHPYYFTYWNPWVGGGRAAMERLPIGAGEGLDLAVDYLNAKPDSRELTLVCGGSQPWCDGIFEGNTLRFATYSSGEWVTADYASTYISHLQRERYPPEVIDYFRQHEPEYRAELSGVVYAGVYPVPQMTHFAGPWNILDGQGQLLGYELSPALEGGTGGQAGDAIEATVWWTNLGAGVDSLVVRWIDATGYEWGRTGVVPRPEYAATSRAERKIVAGAASLEIPPGTPPGLYFLRMGVVEPETGRLLGEFPLPDDGNKLLVSQGRRFTDPKLVDISTPVNQPLAPEITLLGYTRPEQVLTPAEPVWLALFWQATAAPADYEVELRLRDQAGEEVMRWEGQPGLGRYPTGQWQPGEIVKDVWALQVEPEIPIGQYTLDVSLIPASVETEAQPPENHITIGGLEVWPRPVSYDLSNMQAELGANFGDRLTLLGYDLYFDVEDSTGTGKFSPVLYWQSRADFEAEYSLILTLRAADSNQVVETWQVPLGQERAKTFWKAGETINTIHQFETGPLGDGRYHLDVALKNQATGETEPVNDGSENRFVRIEHVQDKIVVRVPNK